MAKNKRIKADPMVIATLERADSAMMELAGIERDLRAEEDAMNDKIALLKEEAKAKAALLEAQKKAIASALCVFLKMNKAELLKDKKSVELAFGVMGFRASTSIKQMNGISAESSLQLLKDKGLPEGIRIKEELDKEAMRGWPIARLNLVGLTRQDKNEFFIELKEEKLAPGVA